jgi:acyl-CoA thioesterase FadM
MGLTSSDWPVRVPLRWRDYDWLGHVNHISYLDLVLESLGTQRAMGWGDAPGVSMEFLSPRRVGPEEVVVDRCHGGATATSATYTVSTGDGRESQLHTRVTLRQAQAAPGIALPHRYIVAPRKRDVLSEPVVHVTFLDWLQESRGALMRDLFLGTGSTSVAVVRLEYDRYRPVVGSDLDFVVLTGISAIGRSSFSVHSRLEGSGSVLASATAVMVKISLQSGRAVELTESDRAMVEAWRDARSTQGGASDEGQRERKEEIRCTPSGTP